MYYFLVLFMLQPECDRQAEQILKQFRRKRNVGDKLNRVKDTSHSLRGSSLAIDLVLIKLMTHYLILNSKMYSHSGVRINCC